MLWTSSMFRLVNQNLKLGLEKNEFISYYEIHVESFWICSFRFRWNVQAKNSKIVVATGTYGDTVATGAQIASSPIDTRTNGSALLSRCFFSTRHIKQLPLTIKDRWLASNQANHDLTYLQGLQLLLPKDFVDVLRKQMILHMLVGATRLTLVSKGEANRCKATFYWTSLEQMTPVKQVIMHTRDQKKTWKWTRQAPVER